MHGYEIIKEKGFISTNVLVKIQGMIEHNKVGIRKNPGTKLVNSKTGEVIYTPTQEEKEIRDLLKNLEDYINENDDEVDPLIKIALIHYQFESIHPFYEGNGCRKKLIDFLDKNVDEKYYLTTGDFKKIAENKIIFTKKNDVTREYEIDLNKLK